ncbi:hypothetical protein ABL78_6409 [Leptomonas seymouri]|uniref:Uncharacterized protein n=1 Tax=Leptomonas seymouri TaxID=5684 RepID=A0A0N0P488_LEPSE|nr:hypothetical protein ABL78_6409 [Leptomonas seymouri]|eukprot:KPI84547.1 hypothetical protein ABL78_6409 [Leptomonas seymouri]
MSSASATVGVGPTSSSKHVASIHAQFRNPSAGKRTSSASERRLPLHPSSPPSAHSNRCRSASSSGITGSNARTAGTSRGDAGKPSRAASANAARHGGGNPTTAHAGHDVAYLYQQLQDALQQVTRVEAERQQRRVQCRRQLRAYCNDNATLRNIIQAGEIRRRDAAIAVTDGASANAGRAHSIGTRKGSASVTEAELEVVEQRIHLARRRHNRLAHELRVNNAALKKEEEAQAMVAEEADAPLDPASLLMGANRPVYLRMMRLEHGLNEVLRKQSTVGVVSKNYCYHLRALSEEAEQYDVQHRMLESELNDRHRDHLQLLELYDTARAAYSSTVDARTALQESSEKMRHAKEKALQQKRKEVEKELAGTQLQERRVVDLQQQLEEEAQLLEAAENTKSELEKQRWNVRNALTLLQTTSSARNSTDGGAGQAASSTADERITAFETAFRDMMRAANVDTMDKLVEFYETEMEQQCKLQDDLDNLRATRAALQQDTQQLRERLKQTVHCVGAGTCFGVAGSAATSPSLREKWKGASAASPLMEREMEVFLKEEKEALAAQVSENEQNHLLLREVAERMNQLAALVAEYRPDVRLPAIRISPALSKRSSTLPLHAAVLVQKLLALASDATSRNSLKEATAALSVIPNAGVKSSGSDNSRRDGAVPVISSSQLVIPANNRRVPLANERGRRGCGSGDGASFGGGRGHISADVAGISSSAARALLNASEHPAVCLSDSRDTWGGAGGMPGGGALKVNPRRRSSVNTGVGFFEGQDEDDSEDAQLATVAAFHPSSGRVLDFDLDSSDDSDGYRMSNSLSDHMRHGDLTEGGGAATEGGEGGAKEALFLPRGRRSLVKASVGGRSVGSAHGPASGAATVADDDQEDPLCRDEVKKMSEIIQERRRRDAEAEARR